MREGDRLHNLSFDETYRPFLVRPEHSVAEVDPSYSFRADEFLIDPANPSERREALSDFAMAAIRAGYCQVLGPVVLPHAGYRNADPEGDNRLALSAVLFFLQKPDHQP